MEKKKERRQQRRSYLTVAGTAAGAAAAGTVVVSGTVAADLQTQLDSLSQRLAALQDAAALTDIYNDLEDTDSTLAFLPTEVENIRTQGYVFANFLERKVQVLTEQWANIREQVIQAVEERSTRLQNDIDAAERALQAAYSGTGSRAAAAENAILQLESKVSAAQDAIEGMYDTVDENVTQVLGQLEQIQWTLDQAREASFDFYEGEDFVAACRAQLIEREDEGPEGILHLTDERIIFEQKEEIATKKFLFITTEKETRQEFIFDELVGHVEEIKATEPKGGLLRGRKEMLEILFAPEADISEATLRLIGADSDEWAKLITRVKTGEIEQERVRAEGEEAAEAEEPRTVQVQETPTKCPNCGALLTTPIVRGMREIACEYCGTLIRLEDRVPRNRGAAKEGGNGGRGTDRSGLALVPQDRRHRGDTVRPSGRR